jgi:hypothetical protein
MDDSKNFSKKDLEVLCTVKRIYSLKPKLELYYIPCKARTYLNDLSPKNTITILRQILKIFDRAVCSRERYIRGQKFVIYQIIPKNCTQYKPVEICNEDSNYTVSFD